MTVLNDFMNPIQTNGGDRMPSAAIFEPPITSLPLQSAR